jgi:hypothetical protein
MMTPHEIYTTGGICAVFPIYVTRALELRDRKKGEPRKEARPIETVREACAVVRRALRQEQ